MTPPRAAPRNSQGYQQIPVPAGTFTLAAEGSTCDLTPLLDVGAKLTVVYAQFAKAMHIPTKTPSRRKTDPLKRFAKYYDSFRRALKRWESQGLITYETGKVDPRSLEPDQRKGVFVRASEAARIKKPYLIDSMQNSKSIAHDSPLSETRPLSAIPARCGWLRQQAIKRLSAIDEYKLFIRDTKTGALNPELVKKLSNVENLFNEWDKESRQKVIMLRNLRTGEYIQKPYKTRFNNDSRKLYNVKMYNTGINNSLIKWKTGVFLTLTTDPLIWMTPKGEKFTRHIKDKETKKTYHFEGTGQGGNEYEANRHESYAWRKWYEKICQRYKRRIPYIRCVEFQENGLIHTHVLLFDVDWQMPWQDFAKEWGSDYGQGYLNKSYQVVNDGSKWTWKKHHPVDTEGRAPADYLKKYLIKSMYETSGFFMYWATNKRFFTMSESVRYLTLDEKIAKEDFARLHPVTDAFDYVGSSHYSLIPNTIRAYERRKYGKNAIHNLETQTPGKRILHSAEIPYTPPPITPENIEDPDQNDDETQPQTDYEAILQREIAWMEEKRRRLAQKNVSHSEIFQTEVSHTAKRHK